eukprot:8214384-Alexandrium_andersonii.AAC.1
MVRPAPNAYRHTETRRCKRLQQFGAVWSGLLRPLPGGANGPPTAPKSASGARRRRYSGGG